MGAAIVVTLPPPVSANRYWRSFVPKGHQRAIVVVSDEAKAYRTQVGWLMKAAGIREPLRGRVFVGIQLYPARPQDWQKRAQKAPAGWDDTVRSIDLDNAIKVLLDAMKGVAFEDDAWVRRIEAERMEPDGEGRVVVTIRRLVIETPQAALI